MNGCPRCIELERQRDTAMRSLSRLEDEVRAIKLHIEVYVLARLGRLLGEKG